MFDIDDFVETMNEVVLNAEENDIGMWELVDIAANYIDEKLGGKKMKMFTINNYKEFCKEALICPDCDTFEDFTKWCDEHKVHLLVNGCDMVLDYDAELINEIEFSLKELYKVYYEDANATTGNTKITSANLIRKYLQDEIKHEAEGDGEFINVYQRFVRMCSYPTTLSDIAECIRIENDLRGSEVQCLYDDFEDEKLDSIVEKEIKDYLMGRFEVCYSESSDRSFLMFFGRWDHGQVVDFVWGEEDDWESDKKEVVDEFFEEIVDSCNK